MIFVSKILGKSRKILEKSQKKWIRSLKMSPKLKKCPKIKKFNCSQNVWLFWLWTNISPSSDGVERKIGYLDVPSRLVLSRKLVFMMCGNVFPVANPDAKKSGQLGKYRVPPLCGCSLVMLILARRRRIFFKNLTARTNYLHPSYGRFQNKGG